MWDTLNADTRKPRLQSFSVIQQFFSNSEGFQFFSKKHLSIMLLGIQKNQIISAGFEQIRFQQDLKIRFQQDLNSDPQSHGC